jgi:DNA-3-methyladenine glycosylase
VSASPLPPEFFSRDTVAVARDLLGKVLVSRVGDHVTGGRIVETEAYLGADDPGSHAATKGVTKRNAVMYGPPGHAYVYFTYGNHHMLNLVTEVEGIAGAVLIRALEPLYGVGEMRRRRERGRQGSGSRPVREEELANGPGKLAAALGVDLEANGTELGTGRLVVLDAPAPSERVASSGRVGLTQGHELELRFYLEGDPHVSRVRAGRKPSRVRRGEGTP